MNQTQDTASTPKGYLQTFYLIHFALIMGLVMSLVFAPDLPENWEFKMPEALNLQNYLPFIVVLASLVISEMVYKSLISKLNTKDGLRAKMGKLLTAYLIRFAILEAAAFICIFVYDTKNPVYFVCAVVPIMAMLLRFPTKERIIRDLKLSREQAVQFAKLNEVIK